MKSLGQSSDWQHIKGCIAQPVAIYDNDTNTHTQTHTDRQTHTQTHTDRQTDTHR